MLVVKRRFLCVCACVCVVLGAGCRRYRGAAFEGSCFCCPGSPPTTHCPSVRQAHTILLTPDLYYAISRLCPHTAPHHLSHQLKPHLTVLQIGNHARLEDLKAVQHYISTCNRRVDIVSAAWLELCQQEQRLVPVDHRCRLQLSSLLGPAGGAAGSAGGVGVLGQQRAGMGMLRGAGGGLTAGVGGGAGAAGGGGGGVFANTASRGGFPADQHGDKQEGGWVPEYWHEQPADPLRLFDGCYFTLAAVQSHQSEHEKALAHIR